MKKQLEDRNFITISQGATTKGKNCLHELVEFQYLSFDRNTLVYINHAL